MRRLKILKFVALVMSSFRGLSLEHAELSSYTLSVDGVLPEVTSSVQVGRHYSGPTLYLDPISAFLNFFFE